MTEPYIYTFTGKKFPFRNPTIDDISIQDIAHSLSMQPRFCGATNLFLSVAEHCVNVCNRVPDEFKIWGLLHDAAEAYLSDIPDPVKQCLLEYEQMEIKILEVVADKFGMHWYQPNGVPREVLRVDDKLRELEARFLFRNVVKFENKTGKVERFGVYMQAEAEMVFLDKAVKFGLR